MLNPQLVDPKSSPYKVDSLPKNKPLQPVNLGNTPPKKNKRTYFFLTLLFISLAGGLFVIYQYLKINSTSANSFANGQGFSLNTLIQAQGTHLQGENSDRTNIMVYGLTKDGLRTDTMLLVSYYWKEHKIVTLNIPRDLFTSYKGYNGKIVSLYALAKNQNGNDRSYPPQFVSNFISKEYDIPIDYWIVADFNGLKEIVNSVGGITVYNPTAFTDYEFPTDNYVGYMRPAPHFDAGNINLDGSQALIYSRSRHSLTTGEGTDFARSKRQMDVIKAILSKLKSQGALSDVSQINQYLQIFGQNIFTNMTNQELVSFAHTIEKLNLTEDFLKTNWNETSGFICGAVINSQDSLFYGIPGNCSAEAGINSQSPYRLEAINFVHNLLKNGKL